MPRMGRASTGHAAAAWLSSALSQKSDFEFGLDQYSRLIHGLATQMFVLGSGEPARLWELGARGTERRMEGDGVSPQRCWCAQPEKLQSAGLLEKH